MKCEKMAFAKHIFLLLILLAAENLVIAQSKKLTGVVKDDQNMLLVGATVRELGTTNQTVSDSSGTFRLSIVNPNDSVQVSYVGKIGKTYSVQNVDFLNVVLSANNTNGLNEIIVTTALGLKRAERNIGYSVQTVKGSDLTKAREPNALSGLVGKVSGLSVGPSAEMLGRPQVVLRGNKDILYVIDGVPVNSDSWNISPDDIETYTVLKGPNAAALYGFRGQNGAIVITTRRGTKNSRGWEVNFNSSTMLESGYLAIPKAQTEYGRGSHYLYQFGTGYTYGKVGTDVMYDNAQRLPIWGPKFDGQLVKQYDSPYDPITGVRTPTAYKKRGENNLKNFMENGLLSTNNISASASGENYDLRMSYTHTYQKGMAPNTKLNIDNLNLITNYRFSKKLTAEASLNFNTQYTPNIPDVSYGPNSFIYEFSVYGNASYDVRSLKDYWKSPLGIVNNMQYSENYGRDNNPYFQRDNWLRGHYKTDVYGYIKLDYKFTPELDLSVRSQVSTWTQTRTENVPISANLRDYLSWYSFGQYNGDFREDKRTSIENNSDVLLTYNKQLGEDWKLSALLGGSWRSFKYNSTWGTTQNLSIPFLYGMQNSKGAAYNYSFNANMMVYSGYYGVDLGYKKYFSFSTTGRVDHLSTLPQGNRSFYYPSFALSSVLTDYLNLPKAISFLKVRASYADVKSGLTMATIPTAYMMNTNKTTNAGLLGYGDELYSSYDGPTYTNQMGYSLTTYYNGKPSVNYATSISNDKLKPADNKSYEGGIDLRVLDNRLGVSATYFVSDAGPQNYQLPVASSTSYYTTNVNGVTTQKKGWELTLTATPINSSDGFVWNIVANWSTYKERLKEIYGDETGLTINGHRYKVGERMDAYYGTGFVRNTEGKIIYNSAGLPLQNPGTTLGDKKFLGYMNPDYSFGTNNSFAYKNFNFSFQFDGRIGGKIYDRVYNQMINGGTAKESVEGAYGAARLKEWQSSNGGMVKPTPAFVGDGVVANSTDGMVISNGILTNSSNYTFTPNAKAVEVQDFLSSGISGGSNIEEYFMVSRSYAKLREVTLGYTLPSSLLKKGFIKGASISLVGRNLLYFAARKDFDIDQYASGYNFGDNSLNGTSSTNLQSPTARRYGININLTF